MTSGMLIVSDFLKSSTQIKNDDKCCIRRYRHSALRSPSEHFFFYEAVVLLQQDNLLIQARYFRFTSFFLLNNVYIYMLERYNDIASGFVDTSFLIFVTFSC